MELTDIVFFAYAAILFSLFAIRMMLKGNTGTDSLICLIGVTVVCVSVHIFFKLMAIMEAIAQ